MYIDKNKNYPVLVTIVILASTLEPAFLIFSFFLCVSWMAEANEQILKFLYKDIMENVLSVFKLRVYTGL